MKNILVIDGASNSAFDIFAATDDEFSRIFPANEDIAFIDELALREAAEPDLENIFKRIYQRRVPKRDAMGIHGTLHFDAHRKKHYPTRRDEEAVGVRAR